MSARVQSVGTFCSATYSAGQVGAATIGHRSCCAWLMPARNASTPPSSFCPEAPASAAAFAICAFASAGV